jgi:hypothetical protein
MPIDVVGTVSKPRYTGWQLDYCEVQEPTDPDKLWFSHGGEIYKVTLSDVRTPEGRKIVSKLIIGFPAHALRRDWQARKRLHLVKAADDLRKDTGLEYVASHWEYRLRPNTSLAQKPAMKCQAQSTAVAPLNSI